MLPSWIWPVAGWRAVTLWPTIRGLGTPSGRSPTPDPFSLNRLRTPALYASSSSLSSCKNCRESLLGLPSDRLIIAHSALCSFLHLCPIPAWSRKSLKVFLSNQGLSMAL